MQPSLPAKDAAQLCPSSQDQLYTDTNRLRQRGSRASIKTIIIFFTSKLFWKKIFTHNLTHTFYFVIEPKAVCKSTLLSLTPSYRGGGRQGATAAASVSPLPPSHFLFPPCDASSDFDSEFPINSKEVLICLCVKLSHAHVQGFGEKN